MSSSTPEALSGWTLHSGPLYGKIARAIEAAIERGDLRPGTVLPPERSLARSLAVGRSTVVAAYDKLRDDGVLESRRGSGTWVAGADRAAAADGQTDSLVGAALDSSTNIDLATARLPTALAVRTGIEQLSSGLLDDVLDRSGYSPAGLPELRRAIADTYNLEDLPTSPEQILVTSGAQQALSLIIGHVTMSGDNVVVEDPTSPGVLDLLRDRVTVVKGAPSISRAGIDGFVDAIRRNGASAAYFMTAAGPEGLAVQSTDMQGLGTATKNFDGVVIEDASSRALTQTDPPPYLARHSGRAATVVTIGSMSKVFWAGLRVGWIRADEPVIHRLIRQKRRHDLGTPLLSQVLSVWLLNRLTAVRAERLVSLASHYERAADLVGRYLPDFGLTTPQAGATAWLQLPSGSSGPFSEVARRRGVAVVAGETLSVGGAADGFIRVAVGQPAAVQEAGFARLAQAWSAYDRRHAHPGGGLNA